MKLTISGGKLNIYISKDEVEQMIKEKLFMKNEPTEGAFIRCNSVEVSIPLENEQGELL